MSHEKRDIHPGQIFEDRNERLLKYRLLHQPRSTSLQQESMQEVLYMLALIALPFSAQGLEPFGITLEVTFLFVLAFSAVYFWNIPLQSLDRRDFLFLMFITIAVISLGSNLLFGQINVLSDLRGLRSSMRQLVHLSRYVIFYVVYKSFKHFLSSGDWVRRQHLFFKGVVIAALIPAIYGSYQYLAARFDLPLATINNLHGGPYLTPHYLDDLRGSFYTIIATFGEAKTYAGFLLGVIPLIVGLRATMKSRSNFGHLLPIPISSHRWVILLIVTLTAHLALGFSRTGYVAVALLVLFIFIFINRKAAILVSLLALIFITSASLFMGKQPFSLFIEIWNSIKDPLSTGGAMIFRLNYAINKTMESPFLGYGLGNVYEEPIEIIRAGRVIFRFGARDLLGQLLPAVGFLGTALFLSFLASHVYFCLANVRKLDHDEGLRSLLLLSLIALVGAWVVQFISAHVNATLPWILLAENAALAGIVERQNQKSMITEKFAN